MLTGTWQAPGGDGREMRLTVTAVAEHVSVSAKGKRVTADATYPRLLGDSPFARLLNAALAADATSAVKRFAAQGPQVEHTGAYASSDDFHADYTTHIAYVSSDLISLRTDRDEDSGGAHPKYRATTAR